MPGFITLCIVILLNSCCYFCQNNSFSFNHYSIEDGLSQSSVHCIIQDKYGFLWIGTQDGLNRYDGYEFKTYRNNAKDSTSISSNIIMTLFEDHNGIIWVGTENGLNKFDQKKNIFTRYLIDNMRPDALKGMGVLSITEDSQNNIWIGTYLGGLSRLDKKHGVFKNYVYDPAAVNCIPDNTIMSICAVGDNLWLGTFAHGICRYNIKESKFYYYPFSYNPNKHKMLSSEFVSKICKGNNGSILIGTNNGLNIYYPGKNIFDVFQNSSSDPASISSSNISAIGNGNSDTVWIGTRDNGLNLFIQSKKEFIRINKNETDPKTLNDNQILSLCKDRNNNIWVGTRVGGLNKCIPHQRKFEIYNADNNSKIRLCNNSILNFAELDDQKFCIGTDKGLNIIDLKSNNVKYIIASAKKNSIHNDRIISLLKDENVLWIGTDDGLYHYNLVTGNISSYSPKDYTGDIPNGIITRIFKDSDKNIWVGTFSFGLYQINPRKKHIEHFTFDANNSNSISSNSIFSIFEDSEKNIWIGSNALNKFHSGKFTRYRPDGNAQFYAVYSILEYPKKILWLATHGAGLIKFSTEEKSYKYYDENSGLPNNVVYAVLKDYNNNLWISTNKGLSKFIIQKGLFRNYNISDGLPTNEFNSGAFYKNAKGILYFGSIKGAVTFNPDEIVDNYSSVNPIITNFKIFNRQLKGKEFFCNGDELILSHNDNYFSFEMASMDFTNPGKNLYAYMIEGLDTGWINSGNRRYVAYTHLEPGKYTLMVKAANSDGIWNGKAIRIILTITPPFWQTWWFRLTAAILLMILIIFVYKKRISHLVREKEIQEIFSKKLIESQEIERKRIAGELHDGLGQNLLIIKNRSKLALKEPTEQGEKTIHAIRKQVDIISDIASESIDDVRKIAYNLHPYFIDEVGITASINTMISKFSETTSITFGTSIDNIDHELNNEYEISVFRIIQESINNIVKHSGASESHVKILNEQNSIILKISDNGIGIPGNFLNESDPGKGFGLKGIAERTKLCKGTLIINSSKETGTELIITIPVKTT